MREDLAYRKGNAAGRRAAGSSLGSGSGTGGRRNRIARRLAAGGNLILPLVGDWQAAGCPAGEEMCGVSVGAGYPVLSERVEAVPRGVCGGLVQAGEGTGGFAFSAALRHGSP